jgi:ABC-type glycerol-3-phosphate transport system substrate-binding protein
VNLKSTFLIAGLLAIASAAIAQDTIAILAPTIQTTTLAGQENQTFDPLEAAKRVIPRFQLETTTKLNWARVEWASFERTFTAQQALMGTDVSALRSDN